MGVFYTKLPKQQWCLESRLKSLSPFHLETTVSSDCIEYICLCLDLGWSQADHPPPPISPLMPDPKCVLDFGGIIPPVPVSGQVHSVSLAKLLSVP